MRLARAALITCGLVAACTDEPALSIAVHHPAGAQIASTQIAIYDSPALTCDNVRFGDVDATELAGLLVAEETLFDAAPAAGDLDGVPRVDRKVIVARGLAADGSLAAGGCVESGEITGAVALTIDTAVAAVASITESGSDDRLGIAVAVTDAGGAPLPGREVSWRVYGAAGTHPTDGSAAALVGSAGAAVWERAAVACTGSDGRVDLHPVPPDRAGGYEVRPRVAWTAQPVPSYSALIGGSGVIGRATSATGTRPCALGHAAAETPPAAGVCLDDKSLGAVQLVTVFDAAVGSAGVTVTAARSTPIVHPIGVFAAPASSGSGADIDVFAIEGAGSDGLGSATAGAIAEVYGGGARVPCAACEALDDALYVPACGAHAAFLLGHAPAASASASLVAIDLATGAGRAFPVSLGRVADAGTTVALDAAGCMTELDASGTPSTVQVVALDLAPLASLAAPVTRAMFDCDAACVGADLPVGGAGVGFVPGAAPAIVVTALDASGIELRTEVAVAPAGGSDEPSFVALSSVPSAGVPDRVAAGQLDADGAPDLAWDNVARHPLVQVSYAAPGPDGAGSLSALLVSPIGDIIDTLVGDVTGDGLDDVVLVGKSSAIVLPTQTALPPALAAVPADDGAGACPLPLP